MNRRQFLKTAAGAALLGTIGKAAPIAFGADAGTTQPATDDLKTSLNAYSFTKLLNDHLRNRGPGVTLLQVLEFAAKCGFAGFDATGYFFASYPKPPDNATLDEFRRTGADLGLAISGTGVRNNFTTSDAAVRNAGVQLIQQWVEVAARLDAPVIRVFADTQIRGQTWQTVAKGFTRDQVQAWIADDLRQCADHGKQFGVRIGVQNHGDFLQTGQQLLDLVKAVDSDWCRPIVDTGYFKTSDPYVDMALVAPQAVNWQIKQSPLGEESDVPIDLIKLLKIIRKSGYRGYLPIETLSAPGKPYDPYAVVPAFLKQLKDAMAQTA